jgi:hypothetical protein
MPWLAMAAPQPDQITYHRRTPACSQRRSESTMTAASKPFRLIDDGIEHSLSADVSDGRVLITPNSLESSFGWELKPEGLCQNETCIPVRDRSALVPETGDGRVDLAVFASLLGRPLAVNTKARVAALGIAASERASSLATLQAPDFALPDLSGQVHRLSDHRGKKVLLVAYASW